MQAFSSFLLSLERLARPDGHLCFFVFSEQIVPHCLAGPPIPAFLSSPPSVSAFSCPSSAIRAFCRSLADNIRLCIGFAFGLNREAFKDSRRADPLAATDDPSNPWPKMTMPQGATVRVPARLVAGEIFNGRQNSRSLRVFHSSVCLPPGVRSKAGTCITSLTLGRSGARPAK